MLSSRSGTPPARSASGPSPAPTTEEARPSSSSSMSQTSKASLIFASFGWAKSSSTPKRTPSSSSLEINQTWSTAAKSPLNKSRLIASPRRWSTFNARLRRTTGSRISLFNSREHSWEETISRTCRLPQSKKERVSLLTPKQRRRNVAERFICFVYVFLLLRGLLLWIY